MATPADQSLSTLAAQAVAADPKLQNRVRKMVERIIENVEFTLAFGKSDDKASLMKAVVPAMMRSLASVEDDQTAKGQQEAYDRMREAMGGDV